MVECFYLFFFVISDVGFVLIEVLKLLIFEVDGKCFIKCVMFIVDVGKIMVVYYLVFLSYFDLDWVMV